MLLNQLIIHEQKFYLLLRVRRRRPSGQSLRHHFRCRAGRLPRAGQAQPRRLRNLRQDPTSSSSAAKSPPRPSSISTPSPARPSATSATCNDDDVFHADKVFIMNAITSQSPGHRARRGCPRGRGQGHRRAGRRRPGFDVRLRLQRNARADARADHVSRIGSAAN